MLLTKPAVYRSVNYLDQKYLTGALGLTRWDILDLMVKHGISSGPETEDELRREVEDLRRYSEEHRPDAGRQ